LAAMAADVSSAVRRLISRRVKSMRSLRTPYWWRTIQTSALRPMLRWNGNASHFLIAGRSGKSFQKSTCSTR